MSNKNIEMVLINQQASDKKNCMSICYKTFIEILKKYFLHFYIKIILYDINDINVKPLNNEIQNSNIMKRSISDTILVKLNRNLNRYIKITIYDNKCKIYNYVLNDITFEYLYSLNYLLNYSDFDYIYTQNVNSYIMSLELLKTSFIHEYLCKYIQFIHRYIKNDNTFIPELKDIYNCKIIFKFIEEM
jgi:hypothetical protein